MTADSQQSLTLMVTEVPIADPEAPSDPYVEHGPREWAAKKLARSQEVDLSTVQANLEAVQEQIDTLMTHVGPRKAGGMHLSEVEVGLSINGEGSVGVVTVGAEVSISLTYSRADD